LSAKAVVERKATTIADRAIVSLRESGLFDSFMVGSSLLDRTWRNPRDAGIAHSGDEPSTSLDVK
jgi:hypothetical protein